jgi:hypothetical protein
LNRKISDRRRWPRRSSAAPRTDAYSRTPVFDQTALRKLLGGIIPCTDSIDDGAHVNEMTVQCYCHDASAVLCTRQRRKWNDFREIKPAGRNETATVKPDQDARCTNVAQRARAWPAKTHCAWEDASSYRNAAA